MINEYQTSQQIKATRALIKFISDHKGRIDNDLKSCLAALESGNIEKAVAHAKNVKPHGMGGITDWFPPAVFKQETDEYVNTTLHALVNHWCKMISLSFPNDKRS